MEQAPARQPVDSVARVVQLVAWSLGIVAVLLDVAPLYIPAGLLLAVTGAMLFANYRGIRDRMRAREERSIVFRLTELRSATKFGGVLLVTIGLVWLVMGVVELLGG
jgi:hypothetical protein